MTNIVKKPIRDKMSNEEYEYYWDTFNKNLYEGVVEQKKLRQEIENDLRSKEISLNFRSKNIQTLSCEKFC